MGYHKDPKAPLSELPFAFARDCELEIIGRLFFPDGEAFVSEIHFKKSRERTGWSFEFHIPVRDETDGRRHWFCEAPPAPEADAGEGFGPKLQGAIDSVYPQLVLNKEIRNESLVVPPVRPAKWNANGLCAFRRQYIEGFAAACGGAEKAPAQQASPAEREEPGICTGSRAEPGNNFCLLPINHAHRREFLQQPPVAGLKDQSFVIPSHSEIPPRGGSRRLAVLQCRAQCALGRALLCVGSGLTNWCNRPRRHEPWEPAVLSTVPIRFLRRSVGTEDFSGARRGLCHRRAPGQSGWSRRLKVGRTHGFRLKGLQPWSPPGTGQETDSLIPRPRRIYVPQRESFRYRFHMPQGSEFRRSRG